MAARQLDPATAADLADLALKLSQDKKTRKAFGKLVKESMPDSPHAAAFSDLDVEDKFENFKAEQEKRELERQQQAVLARMNERRQALLNGDGGRKYSDEDVGKIEKLMQSKGLTDYDDGATLYAATLPPVDPHPPSEIPQHGSTWEFPEW